jgi:predicted nucleotidyltransferase
MGWTAEQTHEAAQRRLRKEAQRQTMLEERRAAARAHAQELARAIAEADPTVRRIWGFGSTFDNRLRFRETSDIDMAAEGGSLSAWQIAQRSSWKVDWVELDDQDETMVRSVTTSGVVLYER